MQTLRQMINFAGVAAGANAVAQVTLKILNDRPVIPDWIAFDNPAFDFVSLVGTTLTVVNTGLAVGSSNALLTYDHSIERSYGNSSITQLSPAPFIFRGAGVSGNPFPGFEVPTIQRFTAVGAETDINIVLTAARLNDLYSVFPTQAGMTSIVGIDCPDTLAGDRTTTQFRVVFSAALTAGDIIDFLIAGR